MFDTMLSAEPYSYSIADKDAMMLSGLNELSVHHRDNCPEYARILQAMWGNRGAVDRLEDIPFLPVSVFKQTQLRSVPAQDIKLTLTSSGTTGQQVSQILVDAETSMRQQKALARIMQSAYGPKRLPMLLLDTSAVFKRPDMMSARGAGVLGMMRFGREHAYALREDLSLDIEAVEAFLQKHGDQPFLMFGFTFMVWLYLYEGFDGKKLDLSNGVLVHSGGWKKLTDKAVDNPVFRAKLADAFGLTRIHNFYGMVEQIGSAFLEGDDGLLYPPNFGDVIIRDPVTWEPAPIGKKGLIQVLSLIPRSYPGHSLLTEDIGVIENIDTGAWKGKGLRILGRVKKAELRGCSDVFSAGKAA
jgi:Acyl-protein synthetase, LuxE